MTPLASPPPLTEEALAQIGVMAMADAIAFLTRGGAVTPATVEQLAAVALTTAETEAPRAGHWLAIAEAVAARLGNAPARLAALAYTRARVQVHQGELTAAEASLRQAQTLWQSVGDADSYNRSLLGLTQILAMQGRYDEAENAARTAVAAADSAAAPAGDSASAAFATLMRQVAARHNLATLLLYQERHAEALAEHTIIRQRLTANGVADATLTDEAQHSEWLNKLAHSDLNRATALTFLDQPAAAEAALQQAISHFGQAADSINQGRARTNLGRLALRTGQYAAALTHFEAAFRDLLGPTTTIAGATLEQLRPADELLLEYATACLAINLLPEAGQALAQCETLFRTANQPYELGQTRYTQGLLFLRTQQALLAQTALREAVTLFAALENHFWLNRTRLAQAALAYSQQEYAQARQWLALLLPTAAPTPLPAEAALQWDLLGQAEARLLHIRVDLAEGDLASARQQAALLTTLLQSDDPAAEEAPTWPHLRLRLHHLLGKIAYSAGAYAPARDHFKQAIAQLEAQRATLLVEEIRSAFVDDKSELYADLVQTLLAMPATDSATTAAMVAEAFAVVEQSRSRVLLERLQAALDDTMPIGATAAATPDAAAEQQRVAELRAQLHWLYNQLMGESGRRHLGAAINRQLQVTEAALQQIEWRQSPLLAQAQAVDLAAFQAVLAPDQQAIVYAEINQEVLAFLVDRTSVRIYRRLTTLGALTAAVDEFRFQMGRVEVAPDYVARHSQRLESRLRAALQQLHGLLLAPLRPALTAQRLLFVPFGPIHRLPLHALWDGDHYLIEETECSYAPSASLAVFRQERNGRQPLQAWTGFAIDDPAIPAARREVERVARHFARPATYMDRAANRPNLWQAAAASDILHLATHGLFRPDNPFFSALKLADGWVDVRELYRLPLAARLIVLSACESGVGEIAGGDEVVGLARGFLGAGRDSAGRELIASLWNVHDATAADLMDHFYGALLATSQGRPATALRTAQCQAIAQRQHPYYWAPFFVIGA
ncbi:MAG: CHAT domain-containing protein [Caldilinea sp. CFX5]|nr:CHAT domain-containing protein [Caldilinea sp. CFX5]